MRCRRKLMVLLGGALGLAACAGPEIEALGDRSYRLSINYTAYQPYPKAQEILAEQARQLCPGGYEDKQRLRRSRSESVDIWEIRCK